MRSTANRTVSAALALASGLRFFILTLNESYIRDTIPFDIEVDPVERPIGTVFTIAVDWIDEFTTEKQWRRIWKEIIMPRQRMLLEARGEVSHSKQVEIDQIARRIEKEPWILQVCPSE